VGLAGVYVDQVIENLRPPDEGMRLAREATEKALALDPRYAPAHALLGDIAIFYERNYRQAADHLKHALALEPTNIQAIGTGAVLARRLARWDQAIALGEYLVSRDPVNGGPLTILGLAYTYAGRWDEALTAYRTALVLRPAATGTHAVISETLIAKGDAEAALVEGQQEPEVGWRLMLISAANYALGRSAESDATLAELIKHHKQSHQLHIATVLAFRGDADRAFEWLDKTARYHDPGLGSIIAHQMFGRLHDDPRWLPFLRENGLAPEQLAAIKLDVKVPK